MIEKPPTGIAGFDHVADGGLPRGRATRVAGTAGSAKTVFGARSLAHEHVIPECVIDDGGLRMIGSFEGAHGILSGQPGFDERPGDVSSGRHHDELAGGAARLS